MPRCEGYLTGNTGIGQGNYMYWENKSEVDTWFRSKSTGTTFDDYSYVVPESTSKDGYNVVCVHIALPYDASTKCDYIAFKNSNSDNWNYAQVLEREYVNENSTRIYFVIDFVATYWDDLELGECFIERTHVTDDFTGLTNFTTSQYLLAEPVSVSIRHRPEFDGVDLLDNINTHLRFARWDYNLIASVNEDGKFDDPDLAFQAGGAVSGYLYNGGRERMKELLSKYVSFMGKVLNKSSSFAEHITSMYACPLLISSDRDVAPINIESVLSFDVITNNIKVRHAKVYDYCRIRVVGNSGEVILSPAEYGFNTVVIGSFTGSPSGNCCLLFRNQNQQNGVTLNSNSWASIGFAGTMKGDEFNLNIPQLQGTNMSEFMNYLHYFHGYGSDFNRGW